MIAMVCLFVMNVAPRSAHAQAADPSDLLCTVSGGVTADGIISGADNEAFNSKHITIISDIILSIKTRLIIMSATIYTYIVTNVNYISAVYASLVIFIAVYGIMFMTGMIQLKFYDFAIRMLKIGIIAQLMLPTSWLFFNDYVVTFFNGGTDDIIKFITGSGGLFSDISVLGTNFSEASGQFAALDRAVSKLVSPRMFVTILATFLTPNYGLIFGALLLYAIYSFMRAMLTALWVYIMSLVMRTLLFGMAPILIPTILFQRTRHIFDGWINQIISACLQPILLFMFFLFFVRLMEGSLDNIMHTPVCFSKFPEGWRGSGFDFSFWRFMEHTPKGWQPKMDGWELKDGFPIDLMAVLTFLLIADLANRFNAVIIQIAQQIAQASTALTGLNFNPLSAALGGGAPTPVAPNVAMAAQRAAEKGAH